MAKNLAQPMSIGKRQSVCTYAAATALLPWAALHIYVAFVWAVAPGCVICCGSYLHLHATVVGTNAAFGLLLAKLQEADVAIVERFVNGSPDVTFRIFPSVQQLMEACGKRMCNGDLACHHCTYPSHSLDGGSLRFCLCSISYIYSCISRLCKLPGQRNPSFSV